MSSSDPDSASPEPPDGTPPASDAPSRTETIFPGGESASPGATVLAAGAVLGPYRIVTLLGRGGMGVVYEAEELESGRRVALKVLSPGFQREVDRARFLREGRIAASLNHPNCVYVFGAWEIDGRLAIAMELMRETLADRLTRRGPLPPAEAVDAMLQVIAGLDAAAAAGILHRDVKPSNCFVDEQGRVKIGDFGISISAHVTAESGLATARRIVGTPGYASPEQLRGDDVDARTDVYGVGATLYELVTGHAPFDKPNLMSLLMAVANEEPQPPHRANRAIPRGLSRVIQRCLAKKAEHRFPGYTALASALQLYASSVAAAASPGRRAVAALIDHLVLFWAFTSLSSLFSSEPDPVRIIASLAGLWMLRVLYFAVSEGVWGASIGKACVGIRVGKPDGRPAGPGRIACRSALFVLSFDAILALSFYVARSGWLPTGGATVFLLQGGARVAIVIAAQFSTARRANGFAGLHEILTSTRVLERRSVARPAVVPAVGDAPHAAVARVGPYDVRAPSIDGMPPEWSLGFDPVLARPVWIRSESAAAPVVSAARRAVNRPTRLRWLAGRRITGDAWDAYSAAAGLPLLDACRTPRPWADVRWWLWSLAQECVTASRESRPPLLRLDRVRVASGGLATLADDPAHDEASGTPGAHEESTPGDFLSRVAAVALGRPRVAQDGTGAGSGEREPLPADAERLLRELSCPMPVEAGHVVSALQRLLDRPPAITRRLRLLPIAVCLLPVALSGFGFALDLWLGHRRPTVWNDIRGAAASLRALDLADRGDGRLTGELHDALEVLLASRYRRYLLAPQFFMYSGLDLNLSGDYRAVRGRVLRTYPSVDAARVAAAEVTAAPFIVDALRQPAARSVWRLPYNLVAPLWIFAIASVVVSLSFRSGLTRMSGLTVVTGDGTLAGRVLLVTRSLLMWSPILIAGLVQSSVLGMQTVPGIVSLVAVAIMALGAILAWRTPSRGLHDRITGTWVVPR